MGLRTVNNEFFSVGLDVIACVKFVCQLAENRVVVYGMRVM